MAPEPWIFRAMLVPVALLCVTACSSSKSSRPPAATTTLPAASTAKTAYLASANAICATLNTHVAALGTPPADGDKAAAENDQVATLTADTLRQLRALPAPAGDETTVAAVWAKVDALVKDAPLLSAALRAHDQPRVDDASAQIQSDLDAANNAADSYGLTVCGS